MKFDDFKVATRVRKLNLWLQILLGVSLYLGLNFLAARHYMRWDFSESRKNSLSPETVAYIKNLKTPIDIFIVISTRNRANENTSVINDLRSFMRQYEYQSLKPNKIAVRVIDSTVENQKTEALVKRFGMNIDNSVIVAGKARFKIIPISEFYTNVDDTHKKFNGETLTTSAILNAAAKKQPKIYFLKGHGELSYSDPNPTHGLSEFGRALQARNYKLEPLQLSTNGGRIPDDADMIVVAAPKTSLLPVEIEALRRYLLKDNGRMVVFLRTGSACGLEDIFYEWGILSDDMQIYDNGGDFESSDGDLIARTFPQNAHPIVKYLISADMPVQFGSVRPVRQDLGAAADDSMKLYPLILSSASSWAERDYTGSLGRPRYDESTDLAGPIPLAMISTREGGKEHGLNIPGGKLAVFGDENFIANKWFNRLGNSMLAINTVNWMFEADDMLNIPPRNLKTYSLTVSQNELMGLGWRFFILPLAVLLLGVTVSFVRRN